jgi:hypothetical protein
MSKFEIAVLTDHNKLLDWHSCVLFSIIEKIPANLVFIADRNPHPDTGISSDTSFLYLQKKFERCFFRRKISFDRETDTVSFISLAAASYPEAEIRQIDLQDSIKKEIDVVLDFRNNISGGLPVPGSKFGVLRYGTLASWIGSNTPECYWETVDRLPEVEVAVSLKEDAGTERVIFRTGFIPYPNSVMVNINNAYQLAEVLIPWIICGFYSDGACFIDSLEKNHGRTSLSLPLRLKRMPSSTEVMTNFLKVLYGYVSNRLGRPKIKRWFLIVRHKQSDINAPFFINGNTELRAGKNMLWADPFVITVNPFHYIFFEEYIYKTDKAHISVLKLDRDFRIMGISKVLEKPYHLSYPHIITHEGIYYMIPETGSNRTIELYKCTSFPDKWDFVINLFEGIEARDTTIFYFENKWWLFTSVVLYKNETFDFSGLFLYYSDELVTDKWISHPRNPVVCDHRLSRPAGNLFMSDYKIFRPSQDCSGEYGRAININLVTKLNESEYEELLVSRIEPEASSAYSGAHTYNSSSEAEVIDTFM